MRAPHKPVLLVWVFSLRIQVIAPTDIRNRCIFAAPMIVLYLLSIAIAWFVDPAQRRKRVEKAGHTES